MKSSHHLYYDRANEGHESIPGLTSQTSLRVCLQRLTAMQIRKKIYFGVRRRRTH